jgi:hypothetical protein
MKLTKTEQEILDRIDKSSHGSTVVETGLDRGRGRTGQLRPYGVRECEAAQKLKERGLVTLQAERHTTYHRGYGSYHTEILVKRTEADT